MSTTGLYELSEGQLIKFDVDIHGELSLEKLKKEVGYITNKNIKTLNIGSNVTSISERGFHGCSYLSGELVFPNSIIKIGKSSFTNCTSLKKIVFECDILSVIEEYSFACCGFTGSISLPPNVITIEMGAFFMCSEIVNVYFGQKIVEIKKDAFKKCSKLTGQLFFHPSLTKIVYWAFDCCPNIKDVDLSKCDNMKIIESNAFYGCTNLRKLTIPNSIDKIYEHAFGDCYNLDELVIPKNVSEICQYAFKNCRNLSKVLIPRTKIIIHQNVFVNNNFSHCKVSETHYVFIKAPEMNKHKQIDVYLTISDLRLKEMHKSSLSLTKSISLSEFSTPRSSMTPTKSTSLSEFHAPSSSTTPTKSTSSMTSATSRSSSETINLANEDHDVPIYVELPNKKRKAIDDNSKISISFSDGMICIADLKNSNNNIKIGSQTNATINIADVSLNFIDGNLFL